MYRGKMTLFYNGEKLSDVEDDEFFIYDYEERQSWEVIIVLPGVEIIPDGTFCNCDNVEAVIMSETVRWVEWMTFSDCSKLAFVKLSRNLECIAHAAFIGCVSLTSIFIPPSCREIGDEAFAHCDKLIIFQVPRHTQLDGIIIANTALIRASPFATDTIGEYDNEEELNEWIRNLHEGNEFSLHRACSSFNPLDEIVFDIVKRQGLKAFKQPDIIGVMPSQYLSENPFSEIEEQKILKRYILDMMGEVI